MKYLEELIPDAIDTAFKVLYNKTKIIKIISHIDYVIAVAFIYDPYNSYCSSEYNLRILFIDLTNYKNHGYEFWLSAKQIINHFEGKKYLNINFVDDPNGSFSNLILKMVKEIYDSNILQTILMLS